MKINVFWFRRDLRLDDNTALNEALKAGLPVLPVFIFDEDILEELPEDDSRVSFIHLSLRLINDQLHKSGSSLFIAKGKPVSVWEKLVQEYEINAVYANRDYEPYARERDKTVSKFLSTRGISFHSYRDQVLFEENEVLKSDGKPYTVFTPYSRMWMNKFRAMKTLPSKDPDQGNFIKKTFRFPELKDIGFKPGRFSVRPYDLGAIKDYDKSRDIPALDQTSHLSPHLRFGTVSIRKIIAIASGENQVFLNELIWREFFMQILFHFPAVVTENFKPAYNYIPWRNNEAEFERWCRGETGYPMVDAGMRELNQTGYMHNRVRMITAGFLCKHLLIDWRWGEAYFARQLLDYELSSNNGNWQWAAGTGCDAAPYFRVFNPETQQKRFDPDGIYVKRWINDLLGKTYPPKMVEHDLARTRAIETYKNNL